VFPFIFFSFWLTFLDTIVRFSISSIRLHPGECQNRVLALVVVFFPSSCASSYNSRIEHMDLLLIQ